MATGIVSLSEGLEPEAAPVAWGVFQDRSVFRGNNPYWMSGLPCWCQSTTSVGAIFAH